jgi:hypothetical protein
MLCKHGDIWNVLGVRRIDTRVRLHHGLPRRKQLGVMRHGFSFGNRGIGIFPLSSLRRFSSLNDFGVRRQRQSNKIVKRICHIGDLVFERSELVAPFGDLRLASADRIARKVSADFRSRSCSRCDIPEAVAVRRSAFWHGSGYDLQYTLLRKTRPSTAHFIAPNNSSWMPHRRKRRHGIDQRLCSRDRGLSIGVGNVLEDLATFGIEAVVYIDVAIAFSKVVTVSPSKTRRKLMHVD